MCCLGAAPPPPTHTQLTTISLVRFLRRHGSIKSDADLSFSVVLRPLCIFLCFSCLRGVPGVQEEDFPSTVKLLRGLYNHTVKRREHAGTLTFVHTQMSPLVFHRALFWTPLLLMCTTFSAGLWCLNQGWAISPSNRLIQI